MELTKNVENIENLVNQLKKNKIIEESLNEVVNQLN